MKNYKKYILLFLCFTVSVSAYSIGKKYPSYSYVFHEFDVDKSYIYDSDFIAFVLKHEKNMKIFYAHSLQRGKKILPTMKGLLVKEGVSDLFIYISMIESGFSSTAKSPKKAVGLWQFMPETAKHYNLTVCSEYDERCDTSSSTSAAITYLNKLHRQFGKWYLAAMAYNCGEGCVERAIKKAGTDEMTILLDNSLKYLPKETREYVNKILLVAMIGESKTLDFSNSSSGTLIEVNVRSDTDLRDVAKLIKMEYKILHRLNRNMKNGFVPKEKNSYKIVIPIEKIYAFYLRYELTDDKKSLKPDLVSHYVKMGETLTSIAKRYKTNPLDIMKVNHLEDEYLTLDQFLVIPVSEKVFETTLEGTSK